MSTEQRRVGVDHAGMLDPAAPDRGPIRLPRTCSSQLDGSTGTLYPSSSSSSAQLVMLMLGCEKIAFSSSSVDTAFFLDFFLSPSFLLLLLLFLPFFASARAANAFLVARLMVAAAD